MWRKPLGDADEQYGDAVILFHRNSTASPSAGRPLVQAACSGSGGAVPFEFTAGAMRLIY